MGSVSFNEGAQVGINYGSINYQHVREVNQQQDTDKGVLRSLSFPQMLDRRDNIAPAHTDTCRWILDLDDFKNWTLQPRGLLWIKGKPGAGKSTLMAFLYKQLNESQELQQPPAKDRGIQLDFFFSARGTELQHTPLGMLRSLLNQLYDADETVRPPVRKIFEDRRRKYGYGDNHWEWTQVKLEELLADAILESARKHQVMIFVDALDEAGAKSARHVATYFHRLTGRADKMEAAVKICISCRHYPIASDAQAVNIIVEAHNRGDIASYIEDAFVGIATRENQKELNDLTEHLICRADGVFQWIHLLVPSIEQKVADCEPFDHIYSWLREVPAGLEEIYVWIIDHVIEKHNWRQSLLLFQWVCLAERPLTVKELRYALATENVQISLSPAPVSRVWTCPKSLESTRDFIESDDRMKTRIKALSGGLVEVVTSEEYEIVQVVHQSVNDFPCKTGFELFSSHIAAKAPCPDDGKIVLQSQAILYRSCLISVAIFAQFWEPINDSIRDPWNDAVDVEQRGKLLMYAAGDLFTHAKKASGSRIGILKNEVNILQSILEYWIEIMKSHDYTLSPHFLKFEHGTTLLHVAAVHDLVDIIEALLLEGAENIETTDYEGNTALHLAAQNGHIRASKILREKGANCGAKNQDGSTPLTGAAIHGNLELFEWLLHQRTVAETCHNKDGALHVAAESGHNEIVRILLGAHADVNSQGGEYGTCLQAAASSGHIETVRILLDAHADVDAQGGLWGTCLQAAAVGGHIEIVRILLDSCADVNIQSGEYGTCLQAAVSSGQIETVEVLLNAHADVNTQGGLYGTCLQAAVSSGHVEIVPILIDAHADVNAQGGFYGTCLQAAAFSGNIELVRILLDAHADVNAQGGFYGTCLQAAAFSRHVEIVRILLNAHADVNVQGGQYGTCLQAAALTGDVEIVQILLNAHADVNAQSGRYGNALQAATVNGQTDMVRMLLAAQADVNVQGGRYGNALQAATVNGQTDMVRMLLAAQADVNAQGGEYENSIQAAILEGQTNILRILSDVSVDLNAEGGKYQSAIMDALSARCPDNNQFSITAGEIPLPLDGLDRNPLHIAILGHQDGIQRINKISHLPFFKSALDNRDKLFRTPLHAAIYRGRLSSCAIELLSLGADPTVLDGYGRNIVDWIQENTYWMGRIQPHCPQTLPTPHETQYLKVSQSVLVLAEMILDSLPSVQWPLVQQLGHFVLFLNDDDRATYLFQLHLSRKAGILRLECFQCESYIDSPIFVCRRCPNLTLCSSCHRSHHVSQLHIVNHEKLKIDALPGESRDSTSTSEQLRTFLKDLMNDYTAKNADEFENISLKGPLIPSARRNSLLPSSKAVFGPAMIVCTVLLGICGILLRYVY